MARIQINIDSSELDKLQRRGRRYGFRSAGALARALCRLFIHATDGHEGDNLTIEEQFRALSDAQAPRYGDVPVRHNNPRQ